MTVAATPNESANATETAMKELIGSPKSMAEAVLAEAQRNLELSQQSQPNDTEEESPANEDRSSITDGQTNDSDDQLQDKEVKDALVNLWSALSDAGSPAVNARLKEEALGKTLSLVNSQIEVLVQQGLRAYHDWERLNRDVNRANEDIESKDLEIKRLRFAAQQNQTTISVRIHSHFLLFLTMMNRSNHHCRCCYDQNFTRALDRAKSEARDASRLIQAEARLRADLSFLRSERDDALAAATESKRKVELLEEEVRLSKAKLSRCASEKLKVERDAQATLSLARSLHASSQSNDADFYKRKVRCGAQWKVYDTLVSI
jgi:hypothetical protein